MARDTATLPVSVVIPAFNRAELLPRALASVHAQRPAGPAETIVIDDASTDETAAVADSLGARVVRHDRNGGASAARNTGIAAASEQWVALLDSDEEWLPHHLASVWQLREGHVMASSAALVCEAPGSGDRFYGPLDGRPLVLRSPAALIFPENPVVAGTALFRRDLVQQLGGFDTGLRYAEDLDLWLRLLELGTGIVSPAVSHLIWPHAGQKSGADEAPKATQRAIVAAYAERPWYSAVLAEKREAVRYRDELSSVWHAGRHKAAVARAAWILARPRRLIAVAHATRRRRRQRKLGSTIDRRGRVTLAAMPLPPGLCVEADGSAAGRPIVGLGSPVPVALLRLWRRPAAEVLVASRAQALAVRALGARPLKVGR